MVPPWTRPLPLAPWSAPVGGRRPKRRRPGTAGFAGKTPAALPALEAPPAVPAAARSRAAPLMPVALSKRAAPFVPAAGPRPVPGIFPAGIWIVRRPARPRGYKTQIQREFRFVLRTVLRPCFISHSDHSFPCGLSIRENHSGHRRTRQFRTVPHRLPGNAREVSFFCITAGPCCATHNWCAQLVRMHPCFTDRIEPPSPQVDVLGVRGQRPTGGGPALAVPAVGNSGCPPKAAWRSQSLASRRTPNSADRCQ